eukprot:TRINITY_DN12611_c0_g1_i2.p2 TRINITY_DN12611_c0_g1~~TRINITY_DN12611_c0_g1_i2.p2  ORF type:complete len:180 (-),score=54.41 TRINITY_DN12611_c0_g1_i2:202-741(-)
MQEDFEKISEAIETLRKAEQIYESSLGKMNKKTCKIKRNISLLMLKDNQYQEALDELLEVEELEKHLYGEDNIQLGKTYKIIGTLYIITKSGEQAAQYLSQAYSIFENAGNSKLMKEVAAKMKLLRSAKMKELNIGEEEKDQYSGEKGSEDKSNPSASPVKPRSAAKKGKKKGKKKKAY